MKKVMMSILALMLLGGLTSTVQATLIGDTVTASWSFESSSDTTDVVVGAGIELDDTFANLFPNEFFDITANSIIGNFTGGFADGNVFTFSDLDWVDAPGIIVGLELLSSTMTGVDAGDFGFTSDSIAWTTGGSTEGSGGFEIRLITQHVPEPSTFALFGIGLAGMALSRRRKKI